MKRIEQLIHGIVTARRMTVGMLEGVSHEAWFHQPVPGGQHVAWIVGHLALADDWGMLSVGVNDRRLKDLEVYIKSREITGNSSNYPSVERLRGAFDAAHQRFVSRLAEIEESDLDRKTSGPISAYAPDLGTILVAHAWHEGFHCGQLALIRRSLNLSPRWG